MKIAIIGSGIAGLSAAWLLGRTNDITMFEHHASPGMGAFNLQYRHGGVRTTIDVPLRAFNSCYYKNVTALYGRIGVETSHADHSAGFTMAGANKHFLSYRYLRWRASVFPMLDSLGTIGLSSLLIAKDMAVFQLTAPRDLTAGRTERCTILEYLETGGYSKAFIERLMLPTLAAVGTCSYAAAAAYPASVVIDFFAGGLLFNRIRRAKHGADDAIERLLSYSNRVRCNTLVTQVTTTDSGNQVQVSFEGGSEKFDHVVVASQANQAGELVGEEEAAAKALLGVIQYESSELVVHSDPRFAPAKGHSTAPLQFLLDLDEGQADGEHTAQSHLPTIEEGTTSFSDLESACSA